MREQGLIKWGVRKMVGTWVEPSEYHYTCPSVDSEPLSGHELPVCQLHPEKGRSYKSVQLSELLKTFQSQPNII